MSVSHTGQGKITNALLAGIALLLAAILHAVTDWPLVSLELAYLSVLAGATILYACWCWWPERLARLATSRGDDA